MITRALNPRRPTILPILCALMLCSCATTAVKETWKEPAWSGPLEGGVAVVAVSDRGMVREGVENRFARELERAGLHTVRTHKLLSLEDIENDQDAAANRVMEAGARTVLITRLVSSEMQAVSVRAGGERYAPVATGFSPGLPYYGYGWGGYYTLAFRDMSTVWSTQSEKVYLENSLFELKDGRPVWSCISRVVLEEFTDTAAEMDRVALQVVEAMRADGLMQ